MNRRASWLAIVGVLAAGSLWAWLGREERVVVGAERGEAEVVRVGGGGVEAVTVPGLGLATVSGMVRDPQGRPVVGATVCALLDWSLPGASAAARCVASERDGHYRIAGLLPLRSRVSATAPGYVARFHGRGAGASRKELVWLRGGEEAREVDVVLAGGGVEAVRQIVAVVRPGGPAAQAGLLVGDEIVAVAGESVIGADAYLHYNLTRVAPGATVQLGLARGVTIAVKAGNLP